MNDENPSPQFDEESANVMLQIMEALTIIENSARGYRNALVAEGWSEPVAEQIAGDLLIQLNRKAFL